ncbi:MAG: hypothetical protein KDA87_25385 [Planctomycetales bacterium]|nr:hypothetical protein [Planctomycetales bacterium]
MSQVYERSSRQTQQRAYSCELAIQAENRIATHTHFRHHSDEIHVEAQENCLLITGRVPTFYLKQLAQESLRGLGVRIVNHIQVVASNGLSSAAVTRNT